MFTSVNPAGENIQDRKVAREEFAEIQIRLIQLFDFCTKNRQPQIYSIEHEFYIRGWRAGLMIRQEFLKHASAPRLKG